MKHTIFIFLFCVFALNGFAQTSDKYLQKDATNANTLSITNTTINLNEPSFIGSIGAIEDVLDPDQIVVFPNPANDVLHVDLPAAAQLEIRNSLGIILLQQAGITGRNTFNVSALPNGYYFLHVISNGQTVVRRFLVAHK
ncbi:MAG TPA: T9SS type A sorting domain-containing protein [Chitinophagales bacterium]|nr:T9SS type A sorting domain-containing protein [Chitinophagales bacterium]